MENYVKITKTGLRDERKIYVKSANLMFKDRLLMKIDEYSISFKAPTLDYRGKLNKFSNSKSKNWFEMTVCQELKEGTYYFDQEESNEDFLITYFE